MGLSERAVAALARAYSMSEVLSLDDPSVRAQLEEAASGDGDLAFRIGARGIVMDGELQEDSDGCLAELARDLGLAGVDEVRIPPSATPGSLEDFVRSLRDGIDGLRRSLEGLPGISVSFRSVTAQESFEPSGDEELEESTSFREPTATSESAASSEPVGASGSAAYPEDTRSSGAATYPETAGASGATEAAGPSDAEEFATGPGFVRDFPADYSREDEEAFSPGAAAEGLDEVGAEQPTVVEAPAPEEPRDLEEPPEPEAPELMPLVDDYLEADAFERQDAAGQIRQAAGEALEMGAFDRVAEAVEELVLDTEVGSGRPESLDLARELYEPEVAAAIVRRLGTLRDELERDRRIRIATTLRGPISEAFAEALAETDDRGARHAYLDALVAMGDDGRVEAKKMLDDSRWWVIRNGATILAGTGKSSDVEDLTTHLAHDDARVRLQVVRALARIGGEDAAMLLLGMVDDPDPDVRAAVATALGALGLDRAVKFLLERLEVEEEEKVEVQILRALGALGDPGAVPSIEKRAVGTFFSKPSTTVRVAAYRALGSIGTPRATQLLQQARDDRDDDVRRAVRSALERKEGQLASSE